MHGRPRPSGTMAGRDLFGIPQTRVLLPATSSKAVSAIVGDIGAQRLFGEGTDVGTWDQWLTLQGADLDTIVVEEDAGPPDEAAGAVLPLFVERGGERLL